MLNSDKPSQVKKGCKPMMKCIFLEKAAKYLKIEKIYSIPVVKIKGETI